MLEYVVFAIFTSFFFRQTSTDWIFFFLILALSLSFLFHFIFGSPLKPPTHGCTRSHHILRAIDFVRSFYKIILEEIYEWIAF